MRRNLLYWVTIGFMFLVGGLGIGIFIYSIFTSNPTGQESEIEYQSQLTERHLSSMGQPVNEKQRETENPLDSTSQSDLAKDALKNDLLEKQGTASLPSSQSDEDKVGARIKELETQLANYEQQRRALDEKDEEIRELIHAFEREGEKELIEEFKAIEKQMMEADRHGRADEVEELKRLMEQKRVNYNLKTAELSQMRTEVLEQIKAIGEQVKTIKVELNSLKGLRKEG